MRAYIHLMRRLSTTAGVVSALLIAVAVLVICDMVIERYIFNLTTIWQIDVVTYSIVAATFVGSSYVLMERRHINVDIVPLQIGDRGRYWLALATMALSLAFVVVLWVLTTKFWYEAFSENWRSNTVWRARLWIPYLSMPIGLGLLMLQYIAEIGGIVTGETAPFGIWPKRNAA
ncbi:MAG TPA: TRAP transporter small permease [Usitatibacter sp.]|nr:TRAP transporter small permease [Usitatibacter sp.]